MHFSRRGKTQDRTLRGKLPLGASQGLFWGSPTLEALGNEIFQPKVFLMLVFFFSRILSALDIHANDPRMSAGYPGQQKLTLWAVFSFLRELAGPLQIPIFQNKNRPSPKGAPNPVFGHFFAYSWPVVGSAVFFCPVEGRVVLKPTLKTHTTRLIQGVDVHHLGGLSKTSCFIVLLEPQVWVVGVKPVTTMPVSHIFRICRISLFSAFPAFSLHGISSNPCLSGVRGIFRIFPVLNRRFRKSDRLAC